MKRFLFVLLLVTAAMVTFTTMVMAQPTNPSEVIDAIKKVTNWDDIVNLQNAIYSAIILIGGWISAFIPGLRQISSGTYRVLTWAIMVIAGAAILGFGNVWAGAISYFFTTSLYEVVIKLFAKSPKPTV